MQSRVHSRSTYAAATTKRASPSRPWTPTTRRRSCSPSTRSLGTRARFPCAASLFGRTQARPGMAEALVRLRAGHGRSRRRRRADRRRSRARSGAEDSRLSSRQGFASSCRREQRALLEVSVYAYSKVRFRFEGNRHFDAGQLENVLDVENASDLSPAALTEKISKFYREHGFFDVEVQYSERGLVEDPIQDVVFVVREGALVHVVAREYPCLTGARTPATSRQRNRQLLVRVARWTHLRRHRPCRARFDTRPDRRHGHARRRRASSALGRSTIPTSTIARSSTFKICIARRAICRPASARCKCSGERVRRVRPQDNACQSDPSDGRRRPAATTRSACRSKKRRSTHRCRACRIRSAA